MNKKYLFIRRAILIATLSLIFGSFLSARAGETGCQTQPNNNKGDCKMNTEKTYDCIPDWIFNDCIAS